MNEETVICIGFDGKEYETPVSELVPRTSIYGIVIKDGNILLSKQSNGYDLPGGGIEAGESDEAGVEREVGEETGLRVQANRQVGEQKEGYFKRTHSDGVCIHSFMRYYACRLIGGEISTEGFDEAEKTFAEAAEWVPLNQLDTIVVASTNDWRELVKQTAEE
jgi:8-oxo-dGTP pyrophosphatase MutT (NUDIX family)